MVFTIESWVCQENRKRGEGLVSCSGLGLILMPSSRVDQTEGCRQVGDSPGCEPWLSQGGEVRVRKKKKWGLGKILMI